MSAPSLRHAFETSVKALYGPNGRIPCRLLHTTPSLNAYPTKKKGRGGAGAGAGPPKSEAGPSYTARTQLSKEFTPSSSSSSSSSSRRPRRRSSGGGGEDPTAARIRDFSREGAPHPSSLSSPTPPSENFDGPEKGTFRRWRSPGNKSGIGSGQGLLGRAHRRNIFDRSPARTSSAPGGKYASGRNDTGGKPAYRTGTTPISSFARAPSTSTSPYTKNEPEFGAWKTNPNLDDDVQRGRILPETQFTSPPLLPGFVDALKGIDRKSVV